MNILLNGLIVKSIFNYNNDEGLLHKNEKQIPNI